MCTPLMITCDFVGLTERMTPDLPLCSAGNDDDLVVLFYVCFHGLENFRGKGNDFHEVLVAEFTGDRAKDAGAAGVLIFVDDDNGVAVEAEDRPVIAADGSAGADDDALTTSPFLTAPVGVASRMWAVMMSPMPAVRERLPRTPIILATRAPVLSATCTLDSI